MNDPYAILGVPADASRDEVIRAFNRLAEAHNPLEHPNDRLAEPIFGLALEAFHAIMLERHERPQVRSLSVAQYAGLYEADLPNSNDYRSYLRFYPDSTALAVNATEPVQQVAMWFDRDTTWGSRGSYRISQQTLRFTTTSRYGRGQYEGAVINPEELVLGFYSQITSEYVKPLYYRFTPTS
jgi:hypothetical protein